LYNYGYRFYSPAQGRFITRDPSGEFNGGANLYAFVGNDPVNEVDPAGLAPIWIDLPSGESDMAKELEFRTNLLRALQRQRAWDPALAEGVLSRLKLALPNLSRDERKIGTLLYDPKIRLAINMAIRGSMDKHDTAAIMNWLGSYRVDLGYYDALGTEISSLHPRDIDVLVDFSKKKGYSKLDGFMMYGGVEVVNGLAMATTYATALRAAAGRSPVAAFEEVTVNAAKADVEMYARRLERVVDDTNTKIPEPLRTGRVREAQRQADLGLSKERPHFQPTPEDLASSAFRVIVGPPKFNPNTGEPVGTSLDGDPSLEIKSGDSTLGSTYQLRLQVFRSVQLSITHTIRTTRPINATFRGWLQRWGVEIIDE
jgi:hypothetical protein